mgnify:CR=1 FL=1|jgi:hypothetical protein|tara:strand:+ start:938 stop:1543 length:606 start_codon:yes stop_codon:yes gene_type:complete
MNVIKRISIIKLVSISLIVSASVSCADNQTPNLKGFEDNASLKIKALATNLKKELGASMQAGGPVAAIKTCNIKAPEITEQLNNVDNVQIKRTSLRLRNPNNAADNWEQKVLASFEERLASGTPIKDLVHSEKIISGPQTTLRMMRVIPMQPACLSCHGDKNTMNKDLISALEQNYPNDLATGFSIGEIRGAFSASQTFSN